MNTAKIRLSPSTGAEVEENGKHIEMNSKLDINGHF